MEATLISHVDTALVSYDDLRNIVPPPSTQYWNPTAHVELVDTLKDALGARGYRVAREQFALGSHGLKLFGTFDLDNELVPGVGTAIGFRHSNDKRIAREIVGGGRVFVCDNMCFSGDTVITHQKHMWRYNLKAGIEQGLDKWQRKQGRMIADISRLADTVVTDKDAQALLAKALFEGKITQKTFNISYDLFFNKAPRQPEAFADCAPRSAWGLHNALTRALKESNPNVQFNNTIELGRVFGIGTEATYAIN